MGKAVNSAWKAEALTLDKEMVSRPKRYLRPFGSPPSIHRGAGRPTEGILREGAGQHSGLHIRPMSPWSVLAHSPAPPCSLWGRGQEKLALQGLEPFSWDC